MSDKTLSGDELDNLLLTWERKYGEERTNSVGNIYYKIDDLRTALNALVNTLIHIGYDQSDFNSVFLSDKIQRKVTPHKYQGKLIEWRIQVNKQWKQAINEYFPDTRLQEATTPKQVERPTVKLEKPPQDEPRKEEIRKDKESTERSPLFDRPMIDKSKIKGLVMPEYVIVENDPLEFLKKGQK